MHRAHDFAHDIAHEHPAAQHREPGRGSPASQTPTPGPGPTSHIGSRRGRRRFPSHEGLGKIVTVLALLSIATDAHGFWVL